MVPLFGETNDDLEELSPIKTIPVLLRCTKNILKWSTVNTHYLATSLLDSLKSTHWYNDMDAYIIPTRVYVPFGFSPIYGKIKVQDYFSLFGPSYGFWAISIVHE